MGNQSDKDELRQLRDHENMLKNLRNDVNILKEKSDQHDKNHSNLQRDHDNYKQTNDDNINKSKLQFYANISSFTKIEG